MDDEWKELHEKLCKLDKGELVDLISNYWESLRKEANENMNDVDNEIIKMVGRSKLTHVNRLKILIDVKSKFK
jgi:hypothetical protein